MRLDDLAADVQAQPHAGLVIAAIGFVDLGQQLGVGTDEGGEFRGRSFGRFALAVLAHPLPAIVLWGREVRRFCGGRAAPGAELSRGPYGGHGPSPIAHSPSSQPGSAWERPGSVTLAAGPGIATSSGMSSTHKSRFGFRIPELSLGTMAWPDCIELQRRLLALQERQPPADPEAKPIRIGIEDRYGDLVHVVETTRLTEAVKVFELLSDHGLVPGHGPCRASDGRKLMRTYRWPDTQDRAFAARVPTGTQRADSTVPSVARP